jgi:hypothetical protein
MTSVGGAERTGLAALDGVQGAVRAWDPQLQGQVFALLPLGQDVLVAGEFGNVGARPRANLAAVPQVAVAPWVSSAQVLTLSQSAPNPARAVASLAFSLSRSGPVTLQIYDLEGRRVTTVADHEALAAGPHVALVDVHGWRSGCYLYRLEAAGTSATKKMLVVN